MTVAGDGSHQGETRSIIHSRLLKEPLRHDVVNETKRAQMSELEFVDAKFFVRFKEELGKIRMRPLDDFELVLNGASSPRVLAPFRVLDVA